MPKIDPSVARPLAPMQQRFAEEYLVDLDATQAAIRAGYSAKTAGQAGYRLLKNVHVAEAIQAGKKSLSERTGITQERVLQETAIIAFSDVVEHFDVDEHGKVTVAPGAPRGITRAISSIKHKIRTIGDGEVEREVEIRLWDKPSALKLAGRHVATPGFFDKIEVTGKDGGPLRIENVRSSAEKRTRALALVEAARQRAAVVAPAIPADAAGGD